MGKSSMVGMMNSNISLTYLTLRFWAISRGEGTLPSFPGPTIRGAFGLSLRRIVCHLTHSTADCNTCILKGSCAYSVIFEGIPPANRIYLRKYPRIPQPFVLLIEPQKQRITLKPNQYFTFGLRLFGPATTLYPYVIQATILMLKRGLGKERVPFILEKVCDEQGNLIFQNGNTFIATIHPNTLTMDDKVSQSIKQIRIAFQTPTRLLVNGKLSRAPTLEQILRAMVRRVRILLAFYGKGAIPDVPKNLLDATRLSRPVNDMLHPFHVFRYSGRQKRQMTFKGFIGECTYDWHANDINPEIWLRAASLVHIGKATSFGFGRIDYEVME